MVPLLERAFMARRTPAQIIPDSEREDGDERMLELVMARSYLFLSAIYTTQISMESEGTKWFSKGERE